MKYLMISNPGVAPIEAFTLLGVSTSRGDDNKIGQFGSGNKHGTLVCLRMGLDPIIFLGTEQLSFSTEEGKMGEQAYQRVVYEFQGIKEKLSYSLDFGALDWTDTHMALREFISNAIDAVGADKVTMGLTEAPNPIPGCTRVYVPATPEVLAYYRNINYYFLHFTGQADEKVIKRAAVRDCAIYRKGVFVRNIKETRSLWDYNFQGDIKIDESRNMDDFHCKWHATTYMLYHSDPSDFITKVIPSTKMLESSPVTTGCADRARKNEILKAFKEIHGDKAVIAGPTATHSVETAERKGIKVVRVDSVNLSEFLIECGVQSVHKYLANIEGITETPAEVTEQMKEVHRSLWKHLKNLELTGGKSCPALKAFRSVMSASEMKLGFYKDGCVYINIENATSTQTYLEEMAHYITGASDMTRDFQDFAFNIAARMYDKSRSV